jgi:hypothetical protein
MAWYDINKTLTYNCLFNLIIGNRGSGKSYGAKKRAVKQFLDKGYQFVYLRRYKEELDNTAESYFNDIIINNEFPDHKIEFTGGKYFIDGKLFGYAMALTKAKDYKSIAYPNVYLIIFDEFLIEDNGYSHYLRNEVKQFLGFYMSIDRYRGCIVFFLSNAVTMINPYTIFWGLSLPYNSNIARKGDILLQLVNDDEFIKERKATRFGKLIEGTEFAEYAIDNKFTQDSRTFLMKKTEKATYYFTFKYDNVLYGVWVDYSEGKFFVSENIDPFFKIVYSVTTDDHSPNMLLIKRANKAILFKTFIDAYKDGIVYYERQKIKNVVMEVIKLCLC